MGRSYPVVDLIGKVDLGAEPKKRAVFSCGSCFSWLKLKRSEISRESRPASDIYQLRSAKLNHQLKILVLFGTQFDVDPEATFARKSFWQKPR